MLILVIIKLILAIIVSSLATTLFICVLHLVPQVIKLFFGGNFLVNSGNCNETWIIQVISLFILVINLVIRSI